MIPGPMDFRGPIMGPVGFKGPCRGRMGFRGPIEMTLRYQYVEDRKPFFLFWRSNHNPDKTVAFFRKDLFFGGEIPSNPDKTVAYSPSVLEFTKLEMRNIWADPGPTFGSRRPWLPVPREALKSVPNSDEDLFFGLHWMSFQLSYLDFC